MAKFDKAWDISDVKIVAGWSQDSSLISVPTAHLPAAPSEEQAMVFNSESLPEFTMTFEDHLIPIFIREKDGTRTLTRVSQNWLQMVLLLGIYGVEW